MSRGTWIMYGAAVVATVVGGGMVAAASAILWTVCRGER